MSNKQITLHDVSINFRQKVCFENFSTNIHHRDKIGIIGRNGSGKSVLLRAIQGIIEPNSGHIRIGDGLIFGYVPQIIENIDCLSGSQRFNKLLGKELSKSPTVLCLDEPTNHLDRSNRKSLMRMLKNYQHTLIVSSHDVELLRNCTNIIWHIHDYKIEIFKGTYDDYINHQNMLLNQQLQQYESLKKEQKHARTALQTEQKRAAQSKKVNQHETDRKLKGAMKEKGSRTAGKKSKIVNEVKSQIDNLVQDFRFPEILKPKFKLNYTKHSKNNVIISINKGSYGYNQPIINDISFQLTATERVAILGDNATGKSTLIKAFLGQSGINTTGTWNILKPQEIGYLDQHYNTLDTNITVFETIKRIVSWEDKEIRKFLNDFLFRKNEEISAQVYSLSGGEKARLSLAQIAAQNPKLLLLDEITNNLDLETKEHVIQVLTAYPGAMIVISHDEDFLKKLNINSYYKISNKQLIQYPQPLS